MYKQFIYSRQEIPFLRKKFLSVGDIMKTPQNMKSMTQGRNTAKSSSKALLLAVAYSEIKQNMWNVDSLAV